MDLLSHIALLATFMGFAGALGSLIWHVRTAGERVPAYAPILFGVFIVVPSALALPFPALVRYGSWLLGAALVVIFRTRPEGFPPWLWSSHFAYQYLGLIMLLILIWALSTGMTLPNLLLGVLAAFAAGMSLQRARLIPNQQSASL